ncbi:MAG: hypothetical protein CSB47_04515 [Proteobacteria bacterium]|nr:MAG: hypothetical protein CSB47_04515 [Pseudomonadota bacterium]
MVDIFFVPVENAEPSIFIGCVGYESRSIQALKSCPKAQAAPVKLIFDYQCGGKLAYADNIQYVSTLDARNTGDFSEFLNHLKSEIEQSDGSVELQLDVTSFDRKKISLIIESIFDRSSLVKSLTISYFPRVFEAPPDELEEVLEFGPISPRFVGEASLGRDSLSLVVGAGYEFGRVVGAIDVLEPEVTNCFYPIGTDPRFEHAIARNNLDFVFLDDPNLLLTYDLLDAESLYFSLRRLVEVEASQRNVLILPLGPKIFAAVSIVVALVCSPSVMVWRHSTVDTARPDSIADAIASGRKSELTFGFKT